MRMYRIDWGAPPAYRRVMHDAHALARELEGGVVGSVEDELVVAREVVEVSGELGEGAHGVGGFRCVDVDEVGAGERLVASEVRVVRLGDVSGGDEEDEALVRDDVAGVLRGDGDLARTGEVVLAGLLQAGHVVEDVVDEREAVGRVDRRTSPFNWL